MPSNYDGSSLEIGRSEKEYWQDFEDFDEKPSSKARLTMLTKVRDWTMSFTRSLCSPQMSGLSSKTLRTTAYLDGLRGFAAFLVYWHHHQLWAHEATSPSQTKILESAFGYDEQYYFACLPVIRILFTGGHFAVTVFFVISGMVLANKPLILIQSGDLMTLGDNLTSALFRRWLRLYIPVIATTFLFLTSWHLFGLWTASTEPKGSYSDELWNWYCEFKNFSYVFRTGGEPWLSYNFHAWSIPVEFRGSIVIYTSLLAFSRSSRNARLWCQVGLVVYFLFITDAAFYAMFISGMLLCDLSLLAENNDLPSFLSRLRRFKQLTSLLAFALSLYLGSVPSHSLDLGVLRASPGWFLLSFLKPQAVFDYKWFYLCMAATMLVWSIPHLPWLKAFFEKQFNQYLGRISFAFYLVHGPILWILGDRLYVATGWVREVHLTHLQGWVGRYPVPEAGPLGLELNFWVVHLVTLPVTVCVADIVTKVVDDRSIQISNWLYQTTLASSVGDVRP